MEHSSWALTNLLLSFNISINIFNLLYTLLCIFHSPLPFPWLQTYLASSMKLHVNILFLPPPPHTPALLNHKFILLCSDVRCIPLVMQQLCTSAGVDRMDEMVVTG